MDKNGKILGLKKNIFFLGLVSLFNDFSNEMIQSVMPVFLGVTLGVPALGIGLIEGLADAAASFLKIFSGWFSDKTGLRKLPAILGYALSVSTRPFFILASSFNHILTIRLVDRVGKGFREAPRDALLSESADHKNLGRSFGYHRAMDALGGMMGPLAAFLILPAIANNYRLFFALAFGVGLFSILSFALVKEVRRPADNKKLSRLDLGLLKKNQAFKLFIAAIFVFGLGTLPTTLMLLRPIEIGFEPAVIPLLYMIYYVIFVSLAFPLGKLSDKIGERTVIALGFLSAIVAYAGLAFGSSIFLIASAFMFFGLYSASTDGIERALAAKLVNRELLATGQGILNAAIGLSSLLAGLIGGGLWTFFGARSAFIYGMAAAAIGLLAFTRVSKKISGRIC